MSTRQISHNDQKENIHRRAQWITKFIEKQRKQLSSKNLEIFLKYNNDMIVHSVSENTRYKNLNHFGLLTKMLQKDWVDVIEEDLRILVADIMIKHSENGKETGYFHS